MNSEVLTIYNHYRSQTCHKSRSVNTGIWPNTNFFVALNLPQGSASVSNVHAHVLPGLLAPFSVPTNHPPQNRGMHFYPEEQMLEVNIVICAKCANQHL